MILIKKCIYSPSLQQDLFEKLTKCFFNYIPFNILPNILNEENIDVVIEEIVKNENFEKSDTETETFNNFEDLKYPEKHEKKRVLLH